MCALFVATVILIHEAACREADRRVENTFRHRSTVEFSGTDSDGSSSGPDKMEAII